MAIPFDYTSEYKRKLRTPEEAARVVKSGDWLDISMGGAFPSLMDEAIAKRKDELRGVKIRGYLIQQPIQMVECDPDREHFIYNSWHMSGYERKLCDRGLCNFNPMVFRNLGAYYDHFLTVNVAITCVTPMNEHGYFNFSVSNASARAVLDKADVVILEVNENLPPRQTAISSPCPPAPTNSKTSAMLSWAFWSPSSKRHKPPPAFGPEGVSLYTGGFTVCWTAARCPAFQHWRSAHPGTWDGR